MNKKIIAKIKKELEKRKEKILKDLESFTREDKHAKDKHRTKFIDLGSATDDNAKEIEVYSTNLSVERVLENNLKDIEQALKRIEKGTYGICKYCSKEIGEKRLLARPVSSACIACKTKLQKGK